LGGEHACPQERLASFRTMTVVTTVLLSRMKQKPSQEWIGEFDAIEHRFAQARIAVLLVLLSGLYMLYQYDLWDRFMDGHYWWMHLMVCVWLIFAAAFRD
jgi:hypothetical protein